MQLSFPTHNKCASIFIGALKSYTSETLAPCDSVPIKSTAIQFGVLPVFNVINNANEVICNLCTNYVVDGSLVSQYTIENINDFDIQIGICLNSGCQMPSWLVYTFSSIMIMLFILAAMAVATVICMMIYSRIYLRIKKMRNKLNAGEKTPLKIIRPKDELCICCGKNKPNMAIMECGHQYTCNECTEKLTECQHCKKPFSKDVAIKIFDI